MTICRGSGPVVIIRGPAVMNTAVCKLTADTDDEYSSKLPAYLVLTLFRGKIRVVA